MGEYYQPKNPPGKKRGPKPEYFTEERKAEMAERGKKGAASPSRELTLEKQRIAKMKRFVKNYRKYNGFKYQACEASKISFGFYRELRAKYKWFADELDHIDESVSDKVESKLMELIDGPMEQKLDVKGNVHDIKLAPNQKAVEFFLSTRAKNRGYGKGMDIPEGGIQIILSPALKPQDPTIQIDGTDE
jgi:hypothetical protein